MYRKMAAKELAGLMGLIAHPERIRIVEELSLGEMGVTDLYSKLELSQATTSRHLSLMKAHHILLERKLGRQVFYSLAVPELANWLIVGLDIIQQKSVEDKTTKKAIKEAKKLWSHA